FGAVLGGMVSGTAVAGVSAAAWVAGGAIGAMVGSAVSQGIGVATGLQDKFSWKSVAMAGITSLVGSPGPLIPGSSFLAAAARGALSSAVTQGIGVATG